ncbi:Crp/Fnr family transcriptional regulator [Aureivirga sp. CE67]|uniref:Crp/Fnr family transcriptional regulator n=1 Tax=Aureivirga sp. CE67 TaxID=1788983 RepID=UPI0018C98CA0|nr:Crp/Fnr family transcriptional regulator [Aureivirga sp. CE67]
MTSNHFLKNIYSEENFSKAEQEEIISYFKKTTIEKDTFLYKEGQYLDYFYILEKGFVRSYAIDFNGKEITTEFYSNHSIVIDWGSFFLKNPTQEFYQASVETICWKLNFDDFQKLFHSIKNFRENGRKTLTGNYVQMKNKNLLLITENAKERYLHLLKTRPEVIQNASLKHIATYLGITDTSLSRIRKEISL